MPYFGTKRKAFISFYQGDRGEVDQFIYKWAYEEGVFIPKALGTFHNDDFIDSGNPEYVMSRIRESYLGDSTVTLVLVGSCTHSRRYIDWELKASLRQGANYTPNGVLGIVLPSQRNSAHLPPRLEANWTGDNVNCYARYFVYPRSAEEIGSWIEDAYAARSGRAYLIQNYSDIMKYNAKCRVCGETHLA